MSITTGVLRALLRLMPRSFRDDYGSDLIATHRLRMRDAAHDRASVLWLSVREIAGCAWLVLRLRLGARSHVPADGVNAARNRMADGIVQDVRFAGRTLRRSPGYTATAVAVLALGIGAGTAIFCAANSFFFRPLPFGDADRLMMLYETNPEFGWVDAAAAPANMLDWRERVDGFADVAAYSDFMDEIPFIVEGEPVLLAAAAVTGNFFDVLGVRAALGRTFRWEETWQAAQRGFVISHALWQSHFGGDPGVVGRIYDFGALRAEIIGVMPAGFSFPSAETQLWSTWDWPRENQDAVWFRRAHFVRTIARLDNGITREQADAEFQSVVRQMQTQFPATNSIMGAGMLPIRDFLIRDVRKPLLILLGAVGVLLLLACANVANLTLVRGAERTRELALRQALGAGRMRVARQLFTESLVLSLLGGSIGIALGWAGVRAMESLTSLGIDGATTIALDTRVVLFTAGATMLTAILFGFVPAIRSSAGRIQGTLVEAGTGGSSGRSPRLVRALVVVEVALALLLVMGAGLLTRSFLLMRDVDPGFSTEGALAVQITVPRTRYVERDDVLAFQDRFLEALESRPGIERAGIVAQLPLNGPSWSSQFKAAGWPPDRVGVEILHRRADAGYFDALGIPLVRGRMFERRDGPDAPNVVLINETFAREYFPDEDPIGQRIAYDREPDETSIWYEIIGIVADQQQISPAQPARAEVFEHRYQDWARTTWLVLRTSTDPVNAIPVVRSVLRDLDPLIPIARTQPMREVWRASMAREEFILTLLAVFGVLALLMATVGVYGVTAQAARRRTREIGIRMALGAGGRDVLGLMLRQSFTLVGAGLVAGLLVTLVATRALAGLLFGIAPNDPFTLLAVVGVLSLAAGIACYVPARRATALDPVRSLKEE